MSAEPQAYSFELIGDAPVYPEEQKGCNEHVEWENNLVKKEETAKSVKYNVLVPPDFSLSPCTKHIEFLKDEILSLCSMPNTGRHEATYSNGFSIQTISVSSMVMTPIKND
ncbi:hypothetical protein K504DRAFT_498580 [Pleomassaria siparia CBS 279.74]|uniref:Uncharacterized protein n=1 Tax=Pleomassaria siparia CBS 279.74 TaxID=1314801 RepID=A0A6G1KLW0_9PLEO|nr:hypothetical protein K504DRAFT_498580 [Pleomassaria siparia CBS 279.74]